MEEIQKVHLFNKKLIEEFEIKNGTEMMITQNGEIKKVVVNWINPFYYWFGSDDIWILPEKIISINGKDVMEKIAKMKDVIFMEKEIKKEAQENAIKKQEQFEKHGCWF